MDKKLEKVRNVFIPVTGRQDAFLIEYAHKMSDARVRIIDLDRIVSDDKSSWMVPAGRSLPAHIMMEGNRKLEKSFLKEQDLMIVSVGTWAKLVNARAEWLSYIPSTLVISGAAKS